jgi:hypothetical protein
VHRNLAYVIRSIVAAPVGDHRRELNFGALTECGLALSIRRLPLSYHMSASPFTRWTPNCWCKLGPKGCTNTTVFLSSEGAKNRKAPSKDCSCFFHFYCYLYFYFY